MLKVLNINATERIECPLDTSEPRAAFTVRMNLSVGERNRLRDLFPGEKAKHSEQYAWMKAITLTALIRVENIEGVSYQGSDLQAAEPHIKEHVIGELEEVRVAGYDNAVAWIGIEIWERVNALGDKEKNSSASPSGVTKQESSAGPQTGTTTTEADTARAI